MQNKENNNFKNKHHQKIKNNIKNFYWKHNLIYTVVKIMIFKLKIQSINMKINI